MSDFGKLNFYTALNPASAFPLDARSYFTSLEAAQAAAATASEVGGDQSRYYFGQKILVSENETETWYVIKRPGVLVPESSGSDEVEPVSLLIDGVNYAVDNVSEPEATGTDGEYSLEINT